MWWDREVYTMAARDKDGKAPSTNARDYYPEDIELEYTCGVLVVEKNYSTLGQVMRSASNTTGAVNSSSWTIQGGPPNGSITAAMRTVPRDFVRASQTEQGYVFHVVFLRTSRRGNSGTFQRLNAVNFIGRKPAVITTSLPGHRKATDAKNRTPNNGRNQIGWTARTSLPISQRIRREVDFNTLGF